MSIENENRINLDWGKVVQVLLRCMDTSSKGENSAAQAERMANGLFAESDRCENEGHKT